MTERIRRAIFHVSYLGHMGSILKRKEIFVMGESEAQGEWQEEAARLWPVAKGSVREYKQKCRSEGCARCKSGEGHPVWQMTYYQNGRQKSKHIPKWLIGELKEALENGRRLEELLVKSGLEFIEERKRAAKSE